MVEQNQLYGENVKFDTQANHMNQIVTKISEIQFSLRMRKDCTREYANLLFLLSEGILNPIKKQLADIALRHELKIQEIQKLNKYPETTFAWSGKHKQRYKSILINREQSEAIQESLPVIINQLDRMGLLLHRDKKTQIC